MKVFNVKEYKAWFESELSLEEIGDLIVKENFCSGFDCDYENVYEWLESYVNEEGFKYNFSRKHCNGNGFEIEPISVMVLYSGREPDNALVERLAKTISSLINTSVNLGNINYLGNEQFEYNSVQTISS